MSKKTGGAIWDLSDAYLQDYHVRQFRYGRGVESPTTAHRRGAKAIRTLRAADADAAPTDRVVGLSPVQIQRRFTAAARAAAPFFRYRTSAASPS